MEDVKVESMTNGVAEAGTEKRSIWHKLFGTYPGDGEMQPKEGIAYSLCGFGQNLICTIIGSYLTIFMTDAIGYGALSVALLMLFARIYDALNDPIMGSIVDRTRTPVGQVPSLSEMDGDPRRGGDHSVLPALVSRKHGRLCGDVHHVPHLGYGVHRLRRAVLGT